MNKKAGFFLLLLVLILVVGSVYIINPLKKPAKAGLQVNVNNGSATLFLNDQHLDQTPYINKEILPGTYNLKIVPDDDQLATFETTLELNPSTLTVVIWDLAQSKEGSGGIIYELEKIDKKDEAEVAFTSDPDGVLIQFADLDQEFTPLVVPNLEPGDYQFQASLTGHNSYQQTLNAVAGFRLHVRIKMAKTDQAISPETETVQDSAEKTATQSAQTETEASQEEGGESEADQPSDQENSEANDDDSSESSSPLGEAVTEKSPTPTPILEDKRVKIKPTDVFENELEVLRVRSKPGLDGDVVGFVLSGEIYPYQEKDYSWYLLEFEDAFDQEEKTGWVSGEYIETLE